MRSLLIASLIAAGLGFTAVGTASAATPNQSPVREAAQSQSSVQPAFCRVWRNCWHGPYSGRRCNVTRRCW